MPFPSWLRATRSRPSAVVDTPQLVDDSPQAFIHLPSYGNLFLTPPNQSGTLHPPSTEVVTTLQGDVEVKVPHGLGRIRCKGIRLVLRGYLRVDWDIIEPKCGRGMEEGIFEESVFWVREGDVVLDEGSSRFEFTIPDMSTRAPGDATSRDQSLQVLYYLFAQILGDVPGTYIDMWETSGGPIRKAIESPDGHVPVKFDLRHLDEDILERAQKAKSKNGTEQSLDIGSDIIHDLKRTIIVQRVIIVEYNPDPAGGLTSLSDRFQTFVPELGLLEASCTSHIFTVASPFHTHINVFDPSPKITIFAYNILVIQKQIIRSPKDNYTVETSKTVPCLTIGTIPRTPNPGISAEALWRGTDAGGADTGAWNKEAKGRFPISDKSRWSTLPGVETPVRLSHKLVFDVFYSVYGEEYDGTIMKQPGPGGMRRMRREKDVVFPSCSIIPQSIELPLYDAPISTTTHGTLSHTSHYQDQPCPTCHIIPSSHLCTTCRSFNLPHVEHLNVKGECKECSGKSLVPLGGPGSEVWDCACILSDEDFEKLINDYRVQGLGVREGGEGRAGGWVESVGRGLEGEVTQDRDRAVAIKIQGELDSIEKT